MLLLVLLLYTLCVQLRTMNKIKLEVPGSFNKCYVVHTDMACGGYVTIYTWSSTCFILHLWLHGVPCLRDSSDKSHSIYLRVAFMTASVVYPEAIIQGWLLAIKTVAINR